MTQSFTADKADTATFDKIVEAHTDVTGAAFVEVRQNGAPSNRVLWVNVNGVCLLRICRIENLTLPTEEIQVPVPTPNNNTAAVMKLVAELATELEGIKRGFSDPTPTRIIPYGATIDALSILSDIKDLLKS